MVHFYAGLAGSGDEVAPFLVRPKNPEDRPLGLGCRTSWKGSATRSLPW